MDETQAAASGRAESGWADVAIRFALAALIVYWSFLLLRPFIAILIWAAILSVALYPIFLWLKRVLGGRSFVDPKELEGAVASSNQLGRSKPRGWQAMTTWPP